MKPSGGQGNIPKGWRLIRLGDVAEVAFSGVDKRTIDGEFPVKLCNYTDVFYNRRIQASMDFMPATATQSELKRWALKQGDVLFTKDSETADEIGIPAFVADDLTGVLCGYHLGLARPSQAMVNGSFLARMLASRKSAQEFGRIANGITRFGLTLDATRSLPILLPPLPEQRAIAAVLDSMDDAIEGADAVIAATEQLRDSLLHELLTRGVPGWHTEWKEAPGLGMIPADWEVVRLGDVGKWLSGGTPSKSHPDFWSGPIPWISPKDMKIRELWGATDHVSKEGVDTGSRLVPPATILMVVRGMILAHSFPMSITRVSCSFNQDIRALICYPGFDPEYVIAALEWQQVRLLSLPTPSTHGTMRVVTEDLQNVPLPRPSSDEQLRIAQLLGRINLTIDKARRERDGLKLLKEAAADALLTGRVRVGVKERRFDKY